MIAPRRVATGTVLSAAVVGLVVLDWLAEIKWGTSLAIIGLTCGALRELYALFERAGVPCHRAWGVACSAALMLVRVGYGHLRLTNVEAHEVFLAGLTAAALAPLMLRVARADRPVEPDPAALRKTAATSLGLLYVTLCASFLLELRLRTDARGDTQGGLVLAVLLAAVVKVGDSAAYFVGRTIGRHALSPVSPKKTWEGAAGGLLASVFVALVLGAVLFEHDARVMAGFGVVAGLAGQGGDLVESWVKRALGAKDSSALFGEMGGLLDMMDALLLAAPAAYLWVELLLPRA